MIDADLIETSGRESMPFEDRLGLLDADVFWLKAQHISAAETHDANALIAWVGDVRYHVERCNARREAGEVSGTDPKPAILEYLSRFECRVLAWRRGGNAEEKRVRMLQSRRR